jgi:REP-associated tyrosine transposase
VSHTYTNILIHAVFSTKNRRPWLTAEVREEGFRYLGGALNQLGGQSLLVNGPSDHVRMLFVQPATLSLSTLVGKIKSNSSGWVKRRWQDRRDFGWQTGYAAFSVSKSQVEQGKRHILNQEAHHRRGGSRGGNWLFEETGDCVRPPICFCPKRTLMPPLRGWRIGHAIRIPRLAPWATRHRPLRGLSGETP